MGMGLELGCFSVEFKRIFLSSVANLSLIEIIFLVFVFLHIFVSFS